MEWVVGQSVGGRLWQAPLCPSAAHVGFARPQTIIQHGRVELCCHDQVEEVPAPHLPGIQETLVVLMDSILWRVMSH